MGAFIYDTVASSIDIDDRTLTHLRLVIMNKLRRSEPFMFDVTMQDGSGRRSFWMHPSVPQQFRLYGHHPVGVNRLWVEGMIQCAGRPSGLRILPEPDLPAISAPVPISG